MDPEIKSPGKGELAGSVTIHGFVVAELAIVAAVVAYAPSNALWVTVGFMTVNAFLLVQDWRRLVKLKRGS